MTKYIGHICINIALILYLIHYLPQLKHNFQAKCHNQISIHFHGLLSIGYISDLLFAFGMEMPWQYCLVSVVGVVCLLTQHVQLKTHLKKHSLFSCYQFLLNLFIIMFFVTLFIKPPREYFLAMGYICQAAFWTYTLPQIWQNYLNKKANGLSNLYLGMSLLCYALDGIASLSLNWPTPSKIGTLFGLTSTSILIYQIMLYRNKTSKEVRKNSLFFYS